MDPDDLAFLRLLIADTDFVGGYVFTDAELGEFYTYEGSSVYRAAARALEVHAASIAQTVGGVSQLIDVQLNGRQAADALLAIAKKYRASGGQMVSMSLSGFAAGEESWGWWWL